MVAGLCCCPEHSWSTLPGSWSSSAPKPLSKKLTRGDPSSCSSAVGFGAQFQAVHMEDGWQDGGCSHTSMGGVVSRSPSITAAPSPSACCLSPFARFLSFLTISEVGKKGRAAAPSWGCWQELHCPDRPAQLRVRVPGVFHPVSGFGCLNCFCLALMRRNLLGAFAFLHGWVAVPKLRALHERGLQGHLGSLLSSKELLGTEAGMLLGALKSQRDLLGKKKQNLGSFKPLGGSFLGWCHTKPWWWLQHFRLPIAWTEASAPHL